MRIPVAIYPFCAELLPVVKHFEQLQEKYSIVQLISPPGLGLGGRDAAYACRHPNTGHVVTELFNAADTSWETLLLTRVVQNVVVDNDKLALIAQEAFEAGKTVVYFDNCTEDVPVAICALSEAYPEKVIIKTEDTKPSSIKRVRANFEPLITPVILVGGLIADEDMLEVIAALQIELKRRGLYTSVVTKHCGGMMLGYHCMAHIFESKIYAETDKIITLNKYFKDIEHEEMPNVILIEAPDAVMRLNNIVPNGFGIHSYMLCQAVTPDYFICCVPCDVAIGGFLSSISEGFQVRIGTTINAAHVSNIIIDSADTLQKKKVSYVHIDLSTVQNQIATESPGSRIPLFDVVTEGGNALCTAIFNSDLLSMEEQ